MNKYSNDSTVLAAQNRAYDLRKFEIEIEDQCMAGKADWSLWEKAVEATDAAVKYAVPLGATYKDLPAI